MFLSIPGASGDKLFLFFISTFPIIFSISSIGIDPCHIKQQYHFQTQ